MAKTVPACKGVDSSNVLYFAMNGLHKKFFLYPGDLPL